MSSDALNEPSEPEEVVIVSEADPVPLAAPWWPVILLAGILWASFLLKLNNLDHTALTRWDESYHAVVARNVAEHPLRPTLVDAPWLPYERQNWGGNHVWLHKPVLPFWQVAMSFRVFGVDAFSLRLPAALLSTLAAWLTYLIGRELLGRAAALISAALQSLNPFLMTLVHGYQFADTIDISLLFWVETGIFFLARSLRTGSWRDVCLAGVAQGLAFLSKSYLAGIIFGLAMTAWLLPVCRLTPRREGVPAFGPARLLALLGVTLATVAPWVVYCATAFPEEFRHEHAEVWKHLYANVENWGAPWDRLVFDYLVAMYGVFYTPILVAAVVLVGKTVTGRHAGLWLVYAWGLGVILPHLLATTKTPSMTMTATPALFLLLGCLIADAWRGRVGPLAALTAVLALGLIFPAVIREPGHGYPRTSGAIMNQNLWVIGHAVGALSVMATVFGLSFLVRKPSLWLRRTALGFCVCALGWFVVETTRAAWNVTARDVNDPYSVTAGEYARGRLPENAVLLCQETKPGEHVTIMFYADRTCYPLRRWDHLDVLSRRIIEAGGVPYVVSPSRLPYPLAHDGGEDGPKIHRWEEN